MGCGIAARVRAFESRQVVGLRPVTRWIAGPAVVWIGCATASPSPTDSVTPTLLNTTESALVAPPPADADLDGRLEGYVAHALARHPELAAAFERWRAATQRSAAAGQLPAVSITYGYFLRSVETRVGPQRHRIGVSQTFPWPGQLSAAESAAATRADAMRRAYEAHALEVRERVAAAYWRVWMARETERIVAAQSELIGMVIETARARVAVGTTTLADIQRLELDASRLRDRVAAARVAATVESAGLAAAAGIDSPPPLVVADLPPQLVRPAEPREDLLAAVADHPRIGAIEALVAAAERDADTVRLSARPMFRVGVDWIETGRGMSTAVDAGKDPVLVQAGISIPLSQGKLAHQADAARATARAHRFERDATLLAAGAEIDRLLARIDDALRRVDLYQSTMIPQAQAAFDAVVGAYASGRAGVADILVAERELLQLELDLAQARVDHATAWASLERVAGRSVKVTAEVRS